jgi:hypothetical protein
MLQDAILEVGSVPDAPRDRAGKNKLTVVLPEHVRRQIRRIVKVAPGACETGVSLFGVRVGDRLVVLAAVGPGPRAMHTPVFYQPDTDYANAAFDALQSALPRISWIGEFHLHPRGMTWLSGHDRETMRRLLADRELDLSDFVAGILQRKKDGITLHAYYFSRAVEQGQAVRPELVASDADIVREARLQAVQEVAGKPEPEQPEDERDQVPVRRGWFARAVSMLRRKTS